MWLLVGLVLRVAQAWSGTGGVAEWEADGFALGWEGRPWASWNRVRPPAFPRAVHAGVDALGLTSVRGVRLLWVSVSLLSLLAAWDLVRALAHWSRAPLRRDALALCWLTACWALLPTLVVSATTPTPEVLVGGALCLLVSAALRFRARPGPVRWTWLVVTGALALGLGGVVVAFALAVSLAVYMAPIPRLGTCVPLLLAAALAGTVAWVAQRGPDPSRPWLPDAAPAYVLATLVDAPLQLDDREPVDPDRRAARIWSLAADELAARRGLDLAGALTNRLLVDHLSPRRFEAVTGLPVLPIGLADVFLRGGLVLFASVTLALSRRSQASAAPRAAAVAGLVALGGALVAAGVGPFALAGFDLVVLAIGVAGLAGADPDRPAPRWIAFTVGGLMLSALGLWALASGRAPSPWTRQLTHRQSQGSRLVGTLADGGPASAADHLLAASLMMDPAAPFQRLPEAAHRHVLAALELAPTDESALRALIEAEVERVRLVQAEELVRSLVDPGGFPTRNSQALLEWVQHKRRQWRTEGGE
jgi:hypothetical protein